MIFEAYNVSRDNERRTVKDNEDNTLRYRITRIPIIEHQQRQHTQHVIIQVFQHVEPQRIGINNSLIVRKSNFDNIIGKAD